MSHGLDAYFEHNQIEFEDRSPFNLRLCERARNLALISLKRFGLMEIKWGQLRISFIELKRVELS